MATEVEIGIFIGIVWCLGIIIADNIDYGHMKDIDGDYVKVSYAEALSIWLHNKFRWW